MMNKNTDFKMYRFVKRCIDIVLSIIFLIILAPVQIVIYLLIKIQEPGPAIFKQERLGRDGRIFDILKFRTMKLQTPSLAAKDIIEEEYVTKLGKFLRMTSLDELPQLINILKGEMSFVGPRPLIPNEGQINEKRRELGIHRLRPGLTGWAQIKARNTHDQDEKLKLDLYYKMHKNLVFDMKIIFMTFFSFIQRDKKS